MSVRFSYGKLGVPVYLLGVPPLVGLRPIPESPVRERPNTVFAYELELEVFGESLLPSYTEGDNTMIVATDSMKNFILHHALDFPGTTPEALLHWIGTRFLTCYPHLSRVRLSALEIPSQPIAIPVDGVFVSSQTAVRFARGERAWTTLTIERTGSGLEVREHESGLRGLEVMKVGGSSFVGYIKDEYTTLPETTDRPLYVALDIAWRYEEPAAALEPQPSAYVAPEQVRDLAQVLFTTMADRSIQQLLYCLAQRMLERFPSLAEVALVGQNRTRQVVGISPADPSRKVLTDPFPAYGCIRLAMQRPIEKEATWDG